MSEESPSSTTTPLVLIVDDDDATRKLIARWLTQAEFRTIEANSGERGLERARENADAVDVIVLDVMMPGIDGFETVERLKADPTTAHVPVILLTAHANAETDIVRGVETGAIDHVSKPFSGPVLIAKVKAMAARVRVERQLRTKLQYAEENASHDALTKLFNRRHFEQRLKEANARATRHREPVSIVMIDLDHFKSVNDTFGHEAGDRVLVHLADVIRAVLRVSDAAFRFGGEEFVLLLRCDPASAVRATERVRQALAAKPIRLGEQDRVIAFSAGIASAVEANGFKLDNLLARADEALYRAKRGGRNRTEIED